jgi:hypothetical protein
MKVLRRTRYSIRSIEILQHLLVAANFLCHITGTFFLLVVSLYPYILNAACHLLSSGMVRVQSAAYRLVAHLRTGVFHIQVRKLMQDRCWYCEIRKFRNGRSSAHFAFLIFISYFSTGFFCQHFSCVSCFLHPCCPRPLLVFSVFFTIYVIINVMKPIRRDRNEM